MKLLPIALLVALGATVRAECSFESVLGDGSCNSMANTQECEWDGGDCCAETCVGDCAWFDCQDPLYASATEDPSPTMTYTPYPSDAYSYTYTPYPSDAYSYTYTYTPFPSDTYSYTYTPYPSDTYSYTYTPYPSYTYSYTYTPYPSYTYSYTPYPSDTYSYTYSPTPTGNLVCMSTVEFVPDEWCTVNCNVGYCPSDYCTCTTSSYTYSYTPYPSYTYSYTYTPYPSYTYTYTPYPSYSYTYTPYPSYTYTYSYTYTPYPSYTYTYSYTYTPYPSYTYSYTPNPTSGCVDHHEVVSCGVVSKLGGCFKRFGDIVSDRQGWAVYAPHDMLMRDVCPLSCGCCSTNEGECVCNQDDFVQAHLSHFGIKSCKHLMKYISCNFWGLGSLLSSVCPCECGAGNCDRH